MDLGNIAKRWRELQGQPSRWLGLLDPLDPDLRRHLLLYGSMSQAAYDAFNKDELSTHVGRSLFSPLNFFFRAGLQPPGTVFPYKITRFIYATSIIKLPGSFLLGSLARDGDGTEVNFMGYVAVATDEGVRVLGRRDIVVVWRGTVQKIEWANNVDFFQVPAQGVLPPFKGVVPEVGGGWMSIYTSTETETEVSRTSAREQALAEVKRLVDLYKDETVSVTVTGHSLGAALATLNAVDIAANGYSRTTTTARTPAPVTAVVYACPRVGDAVFDGLASAQAHLRVLRINNEGDIVPHLPFRLPTQKLDYVDVGVELLINTGESPFLKASAPKHSLELYLHGVAGTIGDKREGFLRTPVRDIALVNKHEDALKDSYKIIKSWWIEKNNGMVLGVDGKWVLMNYEDADYRVGAPVIRAKL